MVHRLCTSLLAALILAGCAASSTVETNACPSGYKWDKWQRFCAPV